MSRKQPHRGRRCGYRLRDRPVFDLCQVRGRFRADLSVVGGVASVLAGYALAFLARVMTHWAPDQVVPTVLLRNAVATTSAAGNAATYFASEIASWQCHSLVTADAALFGPMAVPTAEVAKVEQGIEKLQKKLEEYIPKELARLYGIRVAMEHIIRDLAPQNNLGSQEKTSETREQPTLSQKEKKHRGVVKQHLKELIKLVTATVKQQWLFCTATTKVYTNKPICSKFAPESAANSRSDLVQPQALPTSNLIDRHIKATLIVYS